MAALALDAALDLAPPSVAGRDELLRVAAAVRSGTAPGVAELQGLVRPEPSRPVRRHAARRRMATVATLAASVATIAVGTDLALPSGIGPSGQAAASPARMARRDGVVVLAARDAAPVDARVTSITCPGPTDCLASAGSAGEAFLATSHDAGATWSRRPAPGGATVVADVHCGSPERCWLVGSVGSRAAVEVSVDGGRTWTAGTLPGGIAELRSISCAGVEICWAVGVGTDGAPAVVTTNTGGAHWTAQSLPAGLTRLQSVSCPTAESCWAGGAAGDAAVIVATADGGARWQRVAIPTSGGTAGHATSSGSSPVRSAGAGPGVTSVTCTSPSSCWAVEASRGTTSFLTGGSGGWRLASTATGVVRGVAYAGTGPCAGTCASPGPATGNRALAVVEGSTAGTLAGRAGRGALTCATAVECWVVVTSGAASSADALGPGATLPA